MSSRTLIGNFDACVDQTANFDAFYDLIMNVASAQGYGLDVWGRIVDVSRTLNVGNTAKFFGFDEGGNVGADPFNQSPFFIGQPLTTNSTCDDEPYRKLIFAKAFANICDGSIKSINQLLRTLFPGRGNCFRHRRPRHDDDLHLHLSSLASRTRHRRSIGCAA